MGAITSGKLCCPACGGDLNYIKDSRQHSIGDLKAIKRRRLCEGCGARHSTFEMLEEDIMAASLMLRQMAEQELREVEARRAALLDRIQALSPEAAA